MEKIKIGIVGYGNLGRGVELAVKKNTDMDLVAIFTRRSPKEVIPVYDDVSVVHTSEIENYKDKIDVMILCGGSATDLPEQGPLYASMFNTVDSFDTHAKIPEYFKAVDEKACETGHTSIISIGWDPGLFSLNRMLGEAILPDGKGYTFWGKGVSQGHSDAIRRVKGVKKGVQYTIPIEAAIERVRNGENPEFTTRERHLRECYIVPEEGADLEKITQEIKEMPNYFAEYDTKVIFISDEEFEANHRKMPHGGFVIRSGITGEENKQIVEFSLKLESNPEFTASVLTAYARAAYKMNKEKLIGAKTIFDVPPIYLINKKREEVMEIL